MNWQQASDGLRAIMYNDPWADLSSMRFRWSRAQGLEQSGRRWIPVMRSYPDDAGFPLVVGPLSTGKLIAFRKNEYTKWVPDLITTEYHERENWDLFPWCVEGEPHEVSDVFLEHLWIQPPNMWVDRYDTVGSLDT